MGDDPNADSEGHEVHESTMDEAIERFIEDWYAGKSPNPTTFCEAHAYLGAELREGIDDFLFVAGALPGQENPESRENSGGLPENRQVGDYRILGEIGRGGMGVVYEAVEGALNRRVALKILPPHLGLSNRAVRKFHREAEAGSRPVHPGIVAVHAVGEHRGIHYIAQELVEGGYTLADRLEELEQDDELPRGYFRKVARLIQRVAEALHHAHQSGVVHRDVKPSNILLTGEGMPKVTDFGLARMEDALHLSRTGDLSGTPNYMSPEQISKGPSGVDFRTDVFSLGVTLYELLTLRLPFQGGSSPEVLKRIVTEDPRDPTRISSRVPRDLAVIAMKALKKRPDRRYGSMAEMADDLGRFLAGEPILARPVGPATRALNRMRRNPIVSLALAAAVVALLTGMGLAFHQFLMKLEEATLKEGAYTDIRYRALLAESDQALDRDPVEAMQLAFEATSIRLDAGSRNALYRALASCHEQRTWYLPGIRTACFIGEQSAAVGFDDGTVRTLSLEGGPEDRLIPENAGKGGENGISTQSLAEHDGPVSHLVMSRDGNRLVSAGEGGLVLVTDLNTGEVIDRIRSDWKIRGLDISTDGSLVALATEAIGVTLRDIAQRKTLPLLLGHAWYVNSVRFDSEGRYLVTGSDDTKVRIWDLVENETHIVANHENPVRCAAFLGKNGRILGIPEQGPAQFTDMEGHRLPEYLTGISRARYAVTSPSGGWAAVCDDDHTIALWHLETGRIPSRWEDDPQLRAPEAKLSGHRDAVTAIAFDARESRVLTASADRTLRLWNILPGLGVTTMDTFTIESDWIRTRLDETCSLLAVAGPDRKEAGVWSFKDARRIDRFRMPQNPNPNAIHSEIRGFRFDRDNKKLAIAFSSGNRALVRNIDAEERTKPFLLEGENNEGGDLQNLGFTPEGHVITVHNEGNAVILHRSGRKTVMRWNGPDGDLVIRKAWLDPSGKEALTLDQDYRIRIRPMDDPDGMRVIIEDPEGSNINDLILSREGRRILAWTERTTRLWERNGPNWIPVEGAAIITREGLASAAMDAQGETILGITESGELLVNRPDPDHRGRRTVQLRSSSPFKEAQLDDSGLRIAAFADHGPVALLSAETGERFADLPHRHPIEWARFTPDGKRLITFTKTGRARSWPVTDKRLLGIRDRAPRKLSPQRRLETEILDEKEKKAWESAIALENGISESTNPKVLFEKTDAATGVDEDLRRKIRDYLTRQAPRPRDLLHAYWPLVKDRRNTKKKARIEKARQALDALVQDAASKNVPVIPALRHALGVACLRLDRSEEALKWLDPPPRCPDRLDSLPLDPEGGKLVPILFGAMAYADIKQRDQAITLLEGAERHITAKPNNLRPFYRAFLAEAWDRTGLATPKVLRHSSAKPSESRAEPFLFEAYHRNNEEPEAHVEVKLLLCNGSANSIVPLSRFTDKPISFFVINRKEQRIYYTRNTPGKDGLPRQITLECLSLSMEENNPPFPKILATYDADTLLFPECVHPNGELLYLAKSPKRGNRFGQKRMVYIHLNGRDRYALHPIVGGLEQYFGNSRISRDGKYLLFPHWPGEKDSYSREIWTVELNAEGTAIFNPVQITLNACAESHAMIDPLTRSLVMTRRSNHGPASLMALDPGTGKGTYLPPRPFLHDLILKEDCFDVSPSGQMVLISYEDDRSSSSILVMDRWGNELLRLSPKDHELDIVFHNPRFLH